MFYAPLSNTDIQIAAAASRLEMCLSTLPEQADVTQIVELISNVVVELGGELLFDLRAGENINGDLHWIAVRFNVDGHDNIVHILLGDSDDRFWIGQEEDLPERYARIAQTFAALYGHSGIDGTLAGAVVGSIH